MLRSFDAPLLLDTDADALVPTIGPLPNVLIAFGIFGPIVMVAFRRMNVARVTAGVDGKAQPSLTSGTYGSKQAQPKSAAQTLHEIRYANERNIH